MSNMPCADILGVHVNAQRFDDAVTTLLNWARQPQSRYVCACPVYTLMVCRDNPAVRKAVSGADMVTADGMPVVWIQRRWGFPQAERVYGPDVMRAICEKGAERGIRHFFLGGLPGVATRLAETLKAEIPALEVAGTCAPQVEIGDTPDVTLADALNSANANIIWVGFGSPKQDLWMSVYRPVLRAPLLIGVGAAFDFLSGAKPQAPRWMQRYGLEWAFRLRSEPRRLWRRYLVYNPRFVLQVLWQDLQRRR
jgi:N-acetylglucosaminyldiphosphoundecaprenol N-acetyl-beta-D-mannosaminyltransferase